jgi:hypothetical protein
VKRVVDVVKKNGYCTLPGLYDLSNDVISSARHLLNSEGESYEFGTICRSQAKEFFDNHPVFRQYLFDDWMQQVVMMYSPSLLLYDVFGTHDTINEPQEIARNGYLHFDRLWSFKFMLYLTDCTRESGSFHVVPGSHILGAQLRTENWEKIRLEPNAYEIFPNRIKLDYPDLEVSDPIPLEGPAGTVIVFDSDTFHFGGHVSKKNERLLLRTHYHPARINKYSGTMATHESDRHKVLETWKLKALNEAKDRKNET